MASEGPNNPGTGGDDATVGTVTWSGTGNTFTSNNVRATANVENVTSHYLTVTNFGFAIPSGATIDGIIVEWERSQQDSTTVSLNASRIIKGGTIGSTDKGGANLPSSDTYETLGGAADLWGETWTDTDINASTFGFAVSVTGVDNSGEGNNAQVDHIRITVHYTAAAPAGPSGNIAVTLNIFKNGIIRGI